MISAMSGFDDFLEKNDDILSENDRKSDDFASSLLYCWLLEDGFVSCEDAWSVDDEVLGMEDWISSCILLKTDCIICLTLVLFGLLLLSVDLPLLVGGSYEDLFPKRPNL